MTVEPVQAPPAPSETPDVPPAIWLWLCVLAALVLVVLAVLSVVLHWHWLADLWFGYAWPSDKGNGPEAIQQTILYAAAAVILIPPIRHWFGSWFHGLHAKLDAHHDEAAADRAHLHAKLDSLHRFHGIDIPPPPD